MKTIFFFSILFFSYFSLAQPKIEINAQQTIDGFVLHATNLEYSAVSVKLKLNLKNLSSSKGDEFIAVIPNNTVQFAIAELNKLNEYAGYSYSYDVTSTFGDVTIDSYDSNYKYSLPFDKGKEFQLQQGYFGKYTHQNERSLDIEMPIGTNVCAARKGIIIKQVDGNNSYCSKPSCTNFNNYIDILHDDGTIANYSHLKYKSCKFKVGDSVNEGDFIAESDQTGYTSGPHLHFVVYLPAFENRKSLPTLFKINNGNEFTLLQEKQFYFKNY